MQSFLISEYSFSLTYINKDDSIYDFLEDIYVLLVSKRLYLHEI